LSLIIVATRFGNDAQSIVEAYEKPPSMHRASVLLSAAVRG